MNDDPKELTHLDAAGNPEKVLELILSDDGKAAYVFGFYPKVGDSGTVGSVAWCDLAASGLFSAWLSRCTSGAASTIKPISPASPSLPGEKPLALGPTTEFSDKA